MLAEAQLLPTNIKRDTGADATAVRGKKRKASEMQMPQPPVARKAVKHGKTLKYLLDRHDRLQRKCPAFDMIKYAHNLQWNYVGGVSTRMISITKAKSRSTTARPSHLFHQSNFNSVHTTWS